MFQKYRKCLLCENVILKQSSMINHFKQYHWSMEDNHCKHCTLKFRTPEKKKNHERNCQVGRGAQPKDNTDRLFAVFLIPHSKPAETSYYYFRGCSLIRDQHIIINNVQLGIELECNGERNYMAPLFAFCTNRMDAKNLAVCQFVNWTSGIYTTNFTKEEHGYENDDKKIFYQSDAEHTSIITSDCRLSIGLHRQSEDRPISSSPYWFRVVLKFEDDCENSDWNKGINVGLLSGHSAYYRRDYPGLVRTVPHMQTKLTDFKLCEKHADEDVVRPIHQNEVKQMQETLEHIQTRIDLFSTLPANIASNIVPNSLKKKKILELRQSI